MKRILLILVVALLPIAANAQYFGGARYNDIKDNYNPKNYVASQVDPYSPAWSGVISLWVPGVGQVLSGEVWRGIAFIGGHVFLGSIAEDTANDLAKCVKIDENNNTISWVDKSKGQKDVWILSGCLVADLGLAIWSSIDATRIAKVKNMYYQDQFGKRSAVEMNFAPNVAFTPVYGGVQPTAGMAFSLSF